MNDTKDITFEKISSIFPGRHIITTNGTRISDRFSDNAHAIAEAPERIGLPTSHQER